MYAWLPGALADGGVVVTANRRLARALNSTVQRLAVKEGKTAWLTPSISDWPSWLAERFESSSDPLSLPICIDRFSAGLIWERRFLANMPDDVLNAAGIAREAYRAWQLINDWRIPLENLLAASRRADESCFAQAAMAYQRELDNGGMIDAASMPAVVLRLIRSGHCRLPPRITFAGFSRPTPIVHEFVQALRDCDVGVDLVPDPALSATRQVARFDDEASELRAAGAWAREIMLQDPAAAVAIVRPGLDAAAERVVRYVREGFCPGWQYAGQAHQDAVNVSYGRPLADYPAIRIAQIVLNWCENGIGSRELGLLLRTPLVAIIDAAEGSRLDLELRAMPDQSWSPGQVRDKLGLVDPAAESPAAGGLAALCARLATIREKRPETASAATWAAHFDQILAVVGWPGKSTLTSEEFQLVNRWRELLNAFARTSAVASRISCSRAIAQLFAHAADTLYQPQTEHGLVQVLGVLETAGMEFDHVWMSGLDAARWPPRSTPNPFIARALQKSLGMPDATPADTVDYARRMQSHLESCARDCVFSWARQKDDAEVTASTLLDQESMQAYAGPQDPGWHAATLLQRGELAEVDCDDAIPIGAGEKVGGGAYTVQAQASEPFSGFVKGRLHVAKIEPFSKGLSPKRRGILVHDALHNLFREKPSRHELAAWGRDEIGRRVGSAVDAALASLVRNADPVTLAIIRLERERLRSLLPDFVVKEREREDFTVAALEERLDYQAKGVSLVLQIDRIDRLSDGAQLVVDYKTGNAGHFVDRGGELKDVQLVVYADAIGGDIGGLVNVILDPRRIEYKGSGPAWEKIDAGAWEEQLDNWTSEIRAVLRQLAAGDIRINTGRSTRERRPYAILSRVEALRRG